MELGGINIVARAKPSDYTIHSLQFSDNTKDSRNILESNVRLTRPVQSSHYLNDVLFL